MDIKRRCPRGSQQCILHRLDLSLARHQRFHSEVGIQWCRNLSSGLCWYHFVVLSLGGFDCFHNCHHFLYSCVSDDFSHCIWLDSRIFGVDLFLDSNRCFGRFCNPFYACVCSCPQGGDVAGGTNEVCDGNYGAIRTGNSRDNLLFGNCHAVLHDYLLPQICTCVILHGHHGNICIVHCILNADQLFWPKQSDLPGGQMRFRVSKAKVRGDVESKVREACCSRVSLVCHG